MNKLIKSSFIAGSKSHCSLNDLSCGSLEAAFACKHTDEWPRPDCSEAADEFAHLSVR